MTVRRSAVAALSVLTIATLALSACSSDDSKSTIDNYKTRGKVNRSTLGMPAYADAYCTNEYALVQAGAVSPDMSALQSSPFNYAPTTYAKLLATSAKEYRAAADSLDQLGDPPDGSADGVANSLANARRTAATEFDKLSSLAKAASNQQGMDALVKELQTLPGLMTDINRSSVQYQLGTLQAAMKTRPACADYLAAITPPQPAQK